MSGHFNVTVPLPDEPDVRLNPGSKAMHPFAVIAFGDAWLNIDTPEQAEVWVAAFTEAARLLREAGVS
jgi:hypothetical protein